PYEEGGKLAGLYALGAPIDEREDHADGVNVRARLPRRALRRFARYLVAEARSEPARRAHSSSCPSSAFVTTQSCPSMPTKATPDSISPLVSASSSVPGSARW